MLRRIELRPGFWACLLVLALAPVQAWAQGIPNAVIAVVDTAVLLQQSAAGKNIRAQVDALREQYQAEFQRREQTLRAEEEEIRRQQTILAPEAFAQKRQEFQQKVGRLQAYVRDSTAIVDQAVARALEEVRRNIVLIIDEMQPQHGFNLVLDTGQFIYARTSLDLTQPVLEQLNQRLSAVKVDLQAQPQQQQ